jgi:hypothetical protein
VLFAGTAGPEVVVTDLGEVADDRFDGPRLRRPPRRLDSADVLAAPAAPLSTAFNFFGRLFDHQMTVNCNLARRSRIGSAAGGTYRRSAI